MRVAEADIPDLQAKFGSNDSGVAVQLQQRTSAIIAIHFDLDPAHITDACAKRLSSGFLGGETRRQTVWLPFTLLALIVSKEALIESVAVALKRTGYTR